MMNHNQTIANIFTPATVPKVQDGTLTPVWNEAFKLPYKGSPSALAIDVYDMNYMGKGPFLGRAEIAWEQVVTPPPGDFEYPLKTKPGVSASRQTKVGGMLTLEYSLDMRPVPKVKAESKKDAPVELLQIPKSLWIMKSPALSLTVASAVSLAAVNAFGGSSDPFVVVYVGSAPDPVFKTKHVDANLSPIWNETFIVPLGVSMDAASTTAADFPTLRLEVYDYNRFLKGEFLGACELPPSVYFKLQKFDFPLGPLPALTAKQNRFAQGELSLGFWLRDNVGELRDIRFSRGVYGTLEGLKLVEVHILTARGILGAKRISGKSDAFVVAKCNNKVLGETSTKRATVNPDWAGEKVSINLSHADVAGHDVHLEVWDRDFFSGGTFLGRVVLDSELLHHPGSRDPIERPLQGDRDHGGDGDAAEDGKRATRIKGTLTFKLVSRYERQRLPFRPLEYVDIKRATPTLTNLPLRVVRDPEEEERRQKRERSDLPGLIRKSREQMATYLSKPFERTGLISEQHYGQVISSHQRCQRTLLSSDLCDAVAVPTVRPDAQPAPSSPSKTPHYLDRAKADGDTPKKKGSAAAAAAAAAASGAGAGADEEVPPDVAEGGADTLYLVAKYGAKQLPRRDVVFLEKFQAVLVNGLSMAVQRSERTRKRDVLLASFARLRDLPAFTNDVYIQGIFDLEIALQCPVEIYALLPGGTAMSMASRSKGEPDSNAIRASRLVTLAAKLCRYGVILQIYRGEVRLIDLEWEQANQLALPPLTHPDIVTVFDEVEYEGIVQELVAESVIAEAGSAGQDEVARGGSKKGSSSGGGSARDPSTPSSPDRNPKPLGARAVTPDQKPSKGSPSPTRGAEARGGGMFLAPLLGANEVFLGMVVVRDVDKVPYALYR